MFDPSMAGSPPMAFQTYLTRSIPFRRRQSSASTVGSPNSQQTTGRGRHTASSSLSQTGSPTTPLTPMSPDSFFANRHDSSGSNSNNSGQPNDGIASYDFDPSSPLSPTYNTSTMPSTNTANVTTGAAQPYGRRQSYLSGHLSSISCARCHADLALTSQIISKGFTGRHGRAYLIAPSVSALSSSPCTASPGSLPNTNTHKQVPRHLVTGMHTVADISCAMCGSVLGWKYVAAEEESQRYKVGKFILETKRICIGVNWEGSPGAALGEGEMFDDEDEGVFGMSDMDDLFGIGSANGRSRRRSSAARAVPQQYARGNGPGKGKMPSYGGDSGSNRAGMGGSWASYSNNTPGGWPSSSGGDGSGAARGVRSNSSSSGSSNANDQERRHRREGGDDGGDEEGEEEILFDSQDEDECEDLFAGIWSPALAKKRRIRRGIIGR